MALIPYEPFGRMDRIRNYIDQIFPDSIYPYSLQSTTLPTMDLHETEQEIVATCDIPGLEGKEDVDIDIDNNILTIKGTVKRSQEFQENHLRHRERFAGSFHRSMTLPSLVNESETKATYRNGVLEIRMPKQQKQNQRRIDIDFH